MSDMIILVVDDHDDAREAMKALLLIEGHDVVEATNGREAIAVATRVQPDLILMDMAMPLMDGLTATRLLRAEPKTAGIPIIAVTAHGDDAGWREAALNSGCDDCFTKPLNFALLQILLGARSVSKDAGSGSEG